MFRDVSVIFFLIWLTACSSTTIDPVLPPMKLADIESKLDVAEQWNATYGEGVGENYLLLRPVYYKKRIYILDYQGKLSVINPQDGDLYWEKELGLKIESPANIIDDMLVFGTSKGVVVAIDPETGNEIWRSELSGEILAKPVKTNNNGIVIKSVDGYVYFLNAKTGVRKWTYKSYVPALSLRGSSSPVVFDEMIIVGFDNGKLVALSASSGKVIWEIPVAIARGRTEIERMIDMDADPVIAGDYVYAVTYQGRIASIHIPSARVIWTREFSSNVGMQISDNQLFVTDTEGYVWALDKTNGATLWKQDKLLRRSLTRPAVQKNAVIVGDFNGFLHWLSRDTGKIIGRVRLGDVDDEDTEADDDFIFTKVSNILVEPLVLGDHVLAINRFGHMADFLVRSR